MVKMLMAGLCVCLAGGLASPVAAGAETMEVPENVFKGELVSFPGPWAFQIGRSHIILVSDDELEALSDPDKVLDLSLTFDKHEASLRQICERAQQQGQRTLILAFDHFFSQYRPGQEGRPRRLTPDMDEYIERIAAISQFAASYGLGLELSLLSPLEIGPAYRAKTGGSGKWMHYRKGVRDPETGRFSVQLWRQLRWANNKGPLDLEDAGVRVFAFREKGVPESQYRVVNPEEIVEITPVAQVRAWEGSVVRGGDYQAQRVEVSGEGMADIGPLDRVLVVQQYRTPEMDYFAPEASAFLKDLIDRYADAGVKLNGLYADEMHIQQDWRYFGHHDHGEFALRYVSDGLAKAYAQQYGAQYEDFAKYLVFFTYGQEDFANDLSAKAGVSHVFGETPEAIRETALFRSRYYRLLQNGVVELFVEAKRHAEQRMGYKLESRAHATWAESPTIDSWDVRGPHHQQHQYEYTPNFVWSCTVHQAASACQDYFKWGDYLTGNGNDHCEGGWLDRNYTGLALACSTGILNEVPYSYGAHWGMPNEISARRTAVVNAFGAAGSPLFGMVQDMQHRDVDVLMLYPLDLVAVEERFGSWMNQYAYANTVSTDKLLERGSVNGAALEMAGRRFTTLVALFEPFPPAALLDMMKVFVESGGRVIWSGPPPVLTREGGDALGPWKALFGVEYAPRAEEGLLMPGRQVTFEGTLASVAPQIILTHFLVDRVYPVTPQEGVEPVAMVGGKVAGTRRALASGGTATFLGYRPRDDQSASLGYETRNWFEALSALGAYPPTGVFPGVNDNTEHLSRTTEMICCRFPNGAVAMAPHLRTYEESWPGGFARNAEEDKRFMEQNPPPSDVLALSGFQVNGHTVDYAGTGAMTFRLDGEGNLIAFAGGGCRQVTVDGRTFAFADADIPQLAWAPVTPERRDENGAVLQAIVHGTGTIRIPSAGLPESVKVYAQGAIPGSRGEEAVSRMEDGALVVEVTPAVANRWLFAVPE